MKPSTGFKIAAGISLACFLFSATPYGRLLFGFGTLFLAWASWDLAKREAEEFKSGLRYGRPVFSVVENEPDLDPVEDREWP